MFMFLSQKKKKKKKNKQLKNKFDFPRHITHPILQCTIRELGRLSFLQKKFKKIRHTVILFIGYLGPFCLDGPSGILLFRPGPWVWE